MKDDETRKKEQMNNMIKKARRSVAAAKRHLKDRDYDFSSSRSYYAAFYAIESVLLTKDLVFSKHSGVIGAFNKHFLQTKIFPKEFSKLITRLFRERQIGDYEFGSIIENDEAKESILFAENIVDAIEEYLKNEGFIGIK